MSMADKASPQWDLLSSLPDVVFRQLLGFLRGNAQADSSPASQPILDWVAPDGSQWQGTVPVGLRKRAFLVAQHFLREEDDMDDDDVDEALWMDEVDQYGKRSYEHPMVNVLMLRATSGPVRQMVDDHLNLAPLLNMVPQLIHWLQQHIVSSRPALSSTRATWREFNRMTSVVVNRPQAALHQLRLMEEVEFICWASGISEIKRRQLARLFSPSSVEEAAGDRKSIGHEGSRPIVQVESYQHQCDFTGKDYGEGVYSVIKLSHPSHLQEVVEVAFWAQSIAGGLNDHDEMMEMCMDLRTSSELWLQCLRSEATVIRSAEWLPLLQEEYEIRASKDVLVQLWMALGFSCDDPSQPERDDDRSEKWRVDEIVVVLMALFGWSWWIKFDHPRVVNTLNHPFKYDRKEEPHDYTSLHRNLEKGLRENDASSFVELALEWKSFTTEHLDPLLSMATKREQKESLWELVARITERFIGQLRLSGLPEALAILPRLYNSSEPPPCHLPVAPREVIEGFQVLGANAMHILHIKEAATDSHVEFESKSARWMLRIPPGEEGEGSADMIDGTTSPPSGYILFHYNFAEGYESCHAHRVIRVTVIGDELRAMLGMMPSTIDSEDHTHGSFVLLRWPMCNYEVEGSDPIFATKQLVQIGRLLRLSFAYRASKKEKKMKTQKKKKKMRRLNPEEGITEGSEKEQAREVAALLAFVGEIITWRGAEDFPPKMPKWMYEDGDEEARLLHTLEWMVLQEDI